MNIVVITGASSGIGLEFARQMDSHFKNIEEFWLVARDYHKLNQLANSLQHKCRVFAMDITQTNHLKLLEKTLQKEKGIVRMLINCAGYGIMGPFAEQDKEAETGMVRLNCEALTDMTHRMLPFMKKGSRIIQIASSAAFLPQPDFAVYAATKSYVLSFSRALARELKGRGIYVTAVCPGPVDTPFFTIAEANGSTLAIKKYTMVKAKRVVAQALRDSYDRRTMSVCSLPIQGLWLLSKLIPHDILLSITDEMKERGM